MNSFWLAGESETNTLTLVPPIAALFVVASEAMLMPPLIRGSGLHLLGEPFYAALSFTLHLLTVVLAGWCVALFSPVGIKRFKRSVLFRFVAAAIWFAPLVILARRGLGWTIVGVCVTAVILARYLLQFQHFVAQQKDEVTDTPEPPSNFLSFSMEVDSSLKAHLAWMFLAMALQAGILALLFKDVLAAVLFNSFGFFVLAWKHSQTSTLNRASRVRRSSGRKLTVNLLLAILCMFCGLIYEPAKATAVGSPKAQLGGSKGLHSGVILKPESRVYKLFVPPPRAMFNQTTAQRTMRSRRIPFTGEYWFFDSPYRIIEGKWGAVLKRPPLSSVVEQSNPLMWNLSSVDRWPLNRWPSLVMKAHQSLDPPVDLSCCSGIEVAVQNEDTEPNTFTLELILMDSASTPKMSLSLGDLPVPQGSRRTTLKFTVPRGAHLRRFDTMEITFHLNSPRQNRSASLAIDEFELIPRSL